MKRVLIVAALFVSGCVQPPPPPSPALQRVIAACDAGNTQACITLAELEQMERERTASVAQPVFVPRMQRLDPNDFQNDSAGVRQCIYNQMGGSVFQNCY